MSRSRRSRKTAKTPRRRGVAALDYMLVLGVVLPLAVFILRVGPRIMRLVYELLAAVVSGPFM